jgi:hypothetical protein
MGNMPQASQLGWSRNNANILRGGGLFTVKCRSVQCHEMFVKKGFTHNYCEFFEELSAGISRTIIANLCGTFSWNFTNNLCKFCCGTFSGNFYKQLLQIFSGTFSGNFTNNFQWNFRIHPMPSPDKWVHLLKYIKKGYSVPKNKFSKLSGSISWVTAWPIK